MSNKKGTSWGKKTTGDEVEELLLAAEDDLMLKLNLNSHLAHASSSSSPIDHDLARRFEALKSSKIASVPPPQPQSQQVKTSAAPKSNSDLKGITKVSPPETQQKEKSKEEEEFETILGADLSARFAALKGSSSSKTFTKSQEFPVRSNGGDDADVDNEEDEVEKLIQWAIDAARLDPSSPTDDDGDGDGDGDDDDDDDGDSEEDDDDDDEEDEEKDHRRKQQQQKKNK